MSLWTKKSTQEDKKSKTENNSEPESSIFNFNQNSNLKIQIKQVSGLLIFAAIFYPGWTYVHHLVYPDTKDSYVERLLVSCIFIVLFLIGKKSSFKDETKLTIMKLGRWVLTAHYFSIVYRNEIAIQYAMAAYFLVFLISSLFESPKYFLIYAGFVMSLALLCKSNNEVFPAYAFQLGIGTTLVVSFIGLGNRYKLINYLAESEKIFRTMFENSSLGMMLLTENGSIAAVNSSFGEIFKTTPGDLKTKFQHEFTDVIANINSSNNNSESATRQFTQFEKSISIPDQGENLWIRINATLISPKGSPPFIFTIVENITQQKNIEKQLIQQQQQMTHSSKMTALGEMASGIAHEINNPLSTIGLTAGALQAMLTADKLSKDFALSSYQKIQNTVDRIAKIIKGLRKFSRDASIDPSQPTPINEVIKDSLSLCNESLKSSQIQLHYLETKEDLLVFCRSIEISQVLVNLINNARDAVKGLPEKWIKVNIVEQSDFVRVEISNSGPKIPIEIQKKIFQPFFTTKPIGEGTGLGLSISIGIVKSHHGTLELDPNSDNTCFVMTLPKPPNEIISKEIISKEAI